MKLIHSKLILATAIAAIMTGCGSSDGTTADASQPSNPSNNPINNTTAKTVGIKAIGEIDGFGSVIVNGVHYDTDSAKISIDGEPATEDELDVGMVVEVDGEQSEGEGAKATEISFYSKIAGEIESVDSEARSLVVLGKTVLIDADTKLDDAIDEATLAPLAEGVLVRVSGETNAQGQVIASRIDIREKQENKGDRLFGVIADLNVAGENTFSLEGKTVDFSGARILGGEELADGARTFARGKLVDGVLVADTVLVIGTFTGTDGERIEISRIEISGTLEQKEGVDYLEIGGHAVMNVDAEDLENGDLADIKAGAYVTIKGDLKEDDSIDVDFIKREMAATSTIVGDVEAVNNETGEITLNGKVYNVQDDTDFIDEQADERYFNLKDLSAGDNIVIDSYEDEDGKNIAKSITRVDQDSEIVSPKFGSLHTTLSAVDGNLLTTADGVTVMIGEQTRLAKSVDLENIILGEDGDKLLINGFYNAEGVLEAKFVTTLRFTPSKEDMPRIDQAPDDKIEDIKDKMAELKERIKKEREEEFKELKEAAEQGADAKETDDRIKEIEDRIKDHEHVMDDDDITDMVEVITDIKDDIAKNPETPEEQRAVRVARLEAILAQLKEAGNDEGAAHIEAILANLAQADDLVNESQNNKDLTADEEGTLLTNIDKKFGDIFQSISDKRTIEDSMVTEKEPLDIKNEELAKAKLEALIAKIKAHPTLTKDQKGSFLDTLGTALLVLKESSAKAPQETKNQKQQLQKQQAKK